MKKTRLAIAGATGNVGREIIRLIEERQLLENSPILLASSVSEGEYLPFEESDLQVKSLKDFDYKGIDAIIFATPKEVSEVYVPKAQEAGVKVIDLSSHLRANNNVSLYFDGLSKDVTKRTETVVIPSVPSLQMAKVLAELAAIGVVATGVVSTVMCPVSMSSRDAMEELFAQSASLLGGAGAEEAIPENFNMQIGYNVIPQVGDFKGAHTDAEIAMIMETNRALTQPVPLMATFVYVPTFVGISQSVTLDVNAGFELKKVREMLEKSETLRLIDNPEKGEYSTPFGTAETDAIYISRLREDMLSQGKLQFWMTGDNIRLAALSSLNAVSKMMQ